MEFQSTIPARQPISHKCIVYDARDGRIVLLHEGRVIADLPPGEFLQSQQPEVQAYVRAFHRGAANQARPQ